MTPRVGSRNALAALYFIGLALLAFAFQILVPQEHRGNTAWLDFAVICVIYTINFPLIAIWRFGSGTFTERIPQLSMFLFADPLYCFFAIGAIYWGFVSRAPFRLQLVFQLALFFVASVALVIGWYGSQHASGIAVEEHSTRSSLQGLNSAIARCEVSMSGLDAEWGPTRLRLLKIKEDARFLSPGSAPSILSLEDELVAAVDQITSVTCTHNSTAMQSEIPPLLDRCDAIMALRRQSAAHKGEQR